MAPAKASATTLPPPPIAVPNRYRSRDGAHATATLEPLSPGVEVEIEWQLPKGLLAKDEKFPPVQFTIQK